MNIIKIITPIGSHEIELKQWITGREAQTIDELAYEAVSVKTGPSGNPDITNIDIKKVVTETNHRKIQGFVISVDGKTDDVLNAVLELPEQDTQAVLTAIDDQRKKK